jgi:O-antigen ligase/polysaccharide polymerase Wzy-like membrane protein
VPERKSLAARGLPVLTWGLTFHILAIALLFGFFRLSAPVVRGIAAWKELFGVLLVVATIVRMARGAGPRNAIATADLLAGGWIVLAVLFVVTENTVWRNSVPPLAAFLGVRDAAFFVLFYFIGRGTPEIANDDRALKRCFTVLLVVSVIALLEQIFVTPRMLVGLGVASYINDFLGTPQSTVGNVFGLPDNYWTAMGSHLVRRSGSVFLSGQGFATPFIVLFPGATAWVFARTKSPSRWMRIGYVLVCCGLIVSFTRGAIGVCALQALLVLLYTRRATGAAIAVASAAVVLICAIVVFPSVATFIFETITWQSGSSTSHLKDWTAGITAFFEQPWGWGLGTTDQTALRSGLVPITYDNLYLKYAVEMGVLGVSVLIATLSAFGATGVRLMRTGLTDTQRGIGIMVALAALGIAIDGMTGALFNNPIVAYLFFWYAGTAVTLAQRAPAPVRVPLHAMPARSNA